MKGADIPATAIELTTMRLTPGRTIENFLEANRAIDAWIVRQPGFVSRTIAQDDDGVVVDLVCWTSKAAGEASAAALMATFPDSPIHGIIAQRTVFWTVAPIVHVTS
jgi:hypothetical protein